MPLSSEHMQPLTSSTVEFDYCHDRPLRSLATRYALPGQPCPEAPGRTSCCLLLCAGISLQRQAWLPFIKRLFHLASQPNSRVTLISAWAIERPNHGDAAILNEPMLKEHYRLFFPSRQYSAAIKAFLAGDSLSPRERANIIAVGHSGAGGSILQAIEPAVSGFPISRFIMVEAPFIGREAWTPMRRLYKIVSASNTRRQTSWASIDEAMSYVTKRQPCKGYHPEVWKVMAETYFRSDPENPDRVTTKTTVEQETACFLDDGSHLGALGYLRSIMPNLPTHLILGQKEDFWPPEIYRQQTENLERGGREALVSFSLIEGGSHYLPVQMPEELAIETARLLNEYVGKPSVSRL